MQAVQGLLGDVRHALRQFRKAPVWAGSVAGTLALGIGAATAMFSLGNAVLFRALPYPEPDRLVVLWSRNPQKAIEQERVTLADFADWRARARVFDEIGYSFLWPGSRSTVVRTPAFVAVRSAQVTSSWLRALGVRPVRGRIFTPDEDRRGADLAALISDDFWQQQFGRDPAILGRTLTVDSYDVKYYRIVGVMPSEPSYPAGTEVWLSLGAAQFEPPAPGAGQRCCAWTEVIARLRRGVPVEQAQTELNGIESAILAEHGPADVNPAVSVVPLARYRTATVRRPILILMAAVGCVLLIACVNAANLLLARAGLRQREMAVRGALGATRFRIVRQLLTESAMLSAAGGTGGLILGIAVLDALRNMAPDIPGLSQVRPDAALLLICAAIAVLTGIGFGLAPALQSAGTQFVHGQPGVGGVVGGQRRRLGDMLVIVEVALSTVLLVGAALLLRSLERLDTIDPGFRPEGVITARIDMSSATYSTSALPGPNRPQVFFRRLLEQVRALPGVTAAGGTNRLPLAGVIDGQGDIVTVEGMPTGHSLHGSQRSVTPDYFRVMGMRLLSGRVFTEADTDESEAVVVVDEAAAARFWPGLDPIGRRMTTINPRFASPTPHWMKVVGVVANVRHAGLDAAPRPQFYVPYFRGEWRNAFLVVSRLSGPLIGARGSGAVGRGQLSGGRPGDPRSGEGALGLALRRLVAVADRNAVVTEVRPMEALLAASTSPHRFRARLLTAFSMLALLLAAAGIYGVMSCVVERRTAEIGMRMALGARAADIFGMVLGRGLVLAGAGLAIGSGAALMLRNLIAGLLFETSASDPLAISAAAALLLATALAACWAPSQRAARVDPLIALRHDG
ncbi:MAG TPA: ABC transporter permease [Candidatus Acidoferrales bacterium]|nr:ABC transporter permease [Candidatus Acidoferrales bacterium]